MANCDIIVFMSLQFRRFLNLFKTSSVDMFKLTDNKNEILRQSSELGFNLNF